MLVKYLKYLPVLLFVLHSYPAQAVLENQLKAHPSPYLAMHGDDPVAWQAWGKDVFRQAQKENKLVYVSIGYFSCHWCHVMQRESYQNKDIAGILNKNFIPVKVDRELQPALDARLIEFVERTRGYSGWPLNVFITPQGYPLVGIVYLPPKDFGELLENLVLRWKTDKDSLGLMAIEAAEMIEHGEMSLGPDLDKDLGKTFQSAYSKHILEIGDMMSGGFGEQNKFPQFPQLMALLQAQENKNNPDLNNFLRLTLDQMASQGLHDHVRGGFYRYAVDPNWKIPHFEKMLYDNALMAELYLKAASVYQHKPYEQVGRTTLDFMLKELMSDRGAMIASLSAVDDKGVEGGFYLWQDKSLKHLLDEHEYRLVRSYWGMKNAPTLENGYHPAQAESIQKVALELGIDFEKVIGIISRVKSKLQKEQKNRILPRDDKLLAAWNGLALRALSAGAALEHGDQYRKAAKIIRNFISARLWNGKQLVRAHTGTASLGSAALEDYAYVASGLLEWAKLSGSNDDYALARKITEQAWKRFYTEKGWTLTEELLISYGAHEPLIADSPMPSPSAVIIDVSLKLADHYKDEPMRKRALTALNTGREAILSDPFWYASHISVVSGYQRTH